MDTVLIEHVGIADSVRMIVCANGGAVVVFAFLAVRCWLRRGGLALGEEGTYIARRLRTQIFLLAWSQVGWVAFGGYLVAHRFGKPLTLWSACVWVLNFTATVSVYNLWLVQADLYRRHIRRL